MFILNNDAKFSYNCGVSLDKGDLLHIVPIFIGVAPPVAVFFVPKPASFPQKRSALMTLALVKAEHLVPFAAPGICRQSYPETPVSPILRSKRNYFFARMPQK